MLTYAKPNKHKRDLVEGRGDEPSQRMFSTRDLRIRHTSTSSMGG